MTSTVGNTTMSPEPSSTTTMPRSADVVIVGAGPAGMGAAIMARSHGATVIVLDEQLSEGGQIYRAIRYAPEPRRQILGPDYLSGAELAREFAASGAQHVTGASVWQITPDNRVLFNWQGGVHAIEAKRIILCTGAMERPIPIPGWTLPGVLTAGAAQILLKASGMAPKQPVILAGCGPLLYLLAWQYVRSGVPIAAIVDTTASADYRRAMQHAFGALRSWRYLKKGASLLSLIKKAKIPFYKGATQLRVLGNTSAQGLSFLSGGKAHRIDSQLVLLHQGVVPNTQFSWSICADHVWDERQLCWIPVTDAWGELSVKGVFVAGDSKGISGAVAAQAQGRLSALGALAQLRKISLADRDAKAAVLRRELQPHTDIRPFLETLYQPKKENRIPADDTIVCRCEEVTAGQLRARVDAGCKDPNQAKSFGRCGMGPCQGRQCGLTVTEVLAEACGLTPAQVGYYRIRPPIKPITLGELANEAR
jgi:NADPH-dependent 2,4-dienoyl-CoA reductase/sulfur reductase-like enzyme